MANVLIKNIYSKLVNLLLVSFVLSSLNSCGEGRITIAGTFGGSANENKLEGFSYLSNPAIYGNNTVIANNTPIFTAGTPNRFTISPALPTGLVFDTNTGVISGLTTVNSPLTIYTITAISDSNAVCCFT